MSFSLKLLRWFSRHARPLPWRRHYRPYEVWISEIMLQQTQMDTVLPYFEKWMKAFPDIRSLAQAPESKVLKYWEGLGYYSRARNLSATARQIERDFGGVFPSDYESILQLKGVGRYTAGAISSIAFNQERPIVDGNVLRVLSRVYAISKSIDEPKNRETFWGLQEKLIPAGHAREFNQALMELGALVCTPKNPRCSECPIQTDCRAAQLGKPEDYPVRKARRKTVRVTAAALVLRHQRSVFLLRRPEGKIMGGLWEFPEWKITLGEKITAQDVADQMRRHAEKLVGAGRNRPLLITRLGTLKRNYTHHLETLHVYQAQAPDPSTVTRNASRIFKGWQTAWPKRENFENHPFSSAHAKIAGLLTSL